MNYLDRNAHAQTAKMYAKATGAEIPAKAVGAVAGAAGMALLAKTRPFAAGVRTLSRGSTLLRHAAPMAVRKYVPQISRQLNPAAVKAIGGFAGMEAAGNAAAYTSMYRDNYHLMNKQASDTQNKYLVKIAEYLQHD